MTEPRGPVIPVSTEYPPEIAMAAMPGDERLWVPQAPNV